MAFNVFLRIRSVRQRPSRPLLRPSSMIAATIPSALATVPEVPAMTSSTLVTVATTLEMATSPPMVISVPPATVSASCIAIPIPADGPSVLAPTVPESAIGRLLPRHGGASPAGRHRINNRTRQERGSGKPRPIRSRRRSLSSATHASRATLPI